MKEVKANQVTTLLLDRSWAPVGLIEARDAFTYFFYGKMKGLDQDMNVYMTAGDWYKGSPVLADDQPAIASSHNLWVIPTILQCDARHVMDRKRRRVGLKEMCKISNYTCQICFQKFPYSSLSVEHIIPQSLNGSNDLSNLTITCIPCNSKKDSQYPYFDKKGQPLKPLVEDTKGLEPRIDVTQYKHRPEWQHFAAKTG